MDLSMPPLAFLPYDAPLQPAILQRRRDRFLADVVLEGTGETALAYCVNPGRMEAFSCEGVKVWLLPAPASALKGGRRLLWTWELIEHQGILCCANTQRPNNIVRLLLEQRCLPGLDDWLEMERERTPTAGVLHQTQGTESSKVSASPVSRLDFWLRQPSGEHYIEVKNCHLVHPDGHGYFPDSISSRASRHVEELAGLSSRGIRATALFVVGRGDIQGCVRPSAHHDPTFAQACCAAAAAGVSFRAVRVSCSVEGLTIHCEVPVDLTCYDLAPIARWTVENRATTGWIRSSTGHRVANGPFPHELKATARAKRRKGSRSMTPEKHRKVSKGTTRGSALKGGGQEVPATSFSVALVSSSSRIEL